MKEPLVDQIDRKIDQVAIIQSTVSSNRIEGIEAPLGRIKKLVEHKTTPKNRSEQEIADYRDALATIHANHANMPFTTGIVLEIHRDLYQFVAQQGGRWKMADNEISETRADGTSVRVTTIRSINPLLEAGLIEMTIPDKPRCGGREFKRNRGKCLSLKDKLHE